MGGIDLSFDVKTVLIIIAIGVLVYYLVTYFVRQSKNLTRNKAITAATSITKGGWSGSSLIF